MVLVVEKIGQRVENSVEKFDVVMELYMQKVLFCNTIRAKKFHQEPKVLCEWVIKKIPNFLVHTAR